MANDARHKSGPVHNSRQIGRTYPGTRYRHSVLARSYRVSFPLSQLHPLSARPAFFCRPKSAMPPPVLPDQLRAWKPEHEA